MRAIGQAIYGGPEVLQVFIDVPEPEPGPRDLVVRVHATATNPVDTKVRRGGAAGSPVPAPPLILGWDASGVVAATGSDVEHFRVGDEVYFAGDVARPGSYAEYVAVDERIVAHRPRTLSHLDAAAIPLTALTAWEALVENMGVIPTDRSSEAARTLLVVGGAGGVGSMAIQIARQVCGLRVIATASRPESAAWCTRLGADAVIDHTKSLLDQLRQLGDGGVDLVLNTVQPTQNLPQVLEVVRPFGHVCGIVAPSGPLDLGPLFRKRGHLSFEYMFTRPLFDAAPSRQGAILARVADLLDRGVLLATRTTTMPWDQVQAAHRLLESGRSVGKTVLEVVP
ncbi:zinc-binding alcohol dehydrogenase family protein [Nannocystis punicea]|uniref:Zinc-type alcohol dehydrogenase-like protein n=1 Tax=Nannocystis punicea TaxID=2995304 RepID=A0ABY7H4C8_9BACT|nr:zinc-binding alcohol dehydrogenase family protein [Nannocystis poenicansa]WAS94121.1 zinc-binding alcohol dehydrogenase family protein [Nannocystis poenicansa]